MKKKLTKLIIGVTVAAVLSLSGCGEEVSADVTSDGADTLSTVVTTAGVESIEVSLKSGKSYTEGDTVAKSDVIVTAHMSDGSEKPVTDWSFVDSVVLTYGDNALVITYDTVTAELTVTADPAVTAIVATVDDAERYIGEILDRDSVHVSAQYSDGTEKPDVEDWECADLVLRGEDNSFVIEYKGKKVTVNVSALEGDAAVADIGAETQPTTQVTPSDVHPEDNAEDYIAPEVGQSTSSGVTPTADTVTWARKVPNGVGDGRYDGTYHIEYVTVPNPGLHSVEYYQSHPWKLYNENNSDSFCGQIIDGMNYFEYEYWCLCNNMQLINGTVDPITGQVFYEDMNLYNYVWNDDQTIHNIVTGEWIN